MYALRNTIKALSQVLLASDKLARDKLAWLQVQAKSKTSRGNSRLPVCSQQTAILEDLVTDIPLEFDFLFSHSHAEVISGKQEGEAQGYSSWGGQLLLDWNRSR